MDNMELWNKVKVTDPSAVKKITGKQYQGNSPKPYWLIQRLTEEFGPIGKGWCVNVKSERFEHIGEHDVLHVAVVSMWFLVDGVRTDTFEQMGGTKAAYMTAAGKLMVDEDAGKKSVTDGMVKCMSMIGFAGDIFSGQWDDSKYVEWAAAETQRRTGDEPHDEGDMTPKARAARIKAGVENGDAANAAAAIAGWDQKTIDVIWALLDTKTQDKLTAAWPKAA